MKKIIKLKNLDCANCAAKIERCIAKIKGVESVSVSFMGQRINIECSDGGYETILADIKGICRKIEPDCVVLE